MKSNGFNSKDVGKLFQRSILQRIKDADLFFEAFKELVSEVGWAAIKALFRHSQPEKMDPVVDHPRRGEITVDYRTSRLS